VYLPSGAASLENGEGDGVRGFGILGVARLLVGSALLVGCGAVGGGGTTPANNPVARPATAVTVKPATTGPITQVIGYNGTVQAADTVSLAPVISGRITKLSVDVGSQVKAGDLVAQLDTTTLAVQVAQAQTGVDVANTKLEQIKAGARPESVAAAQANVATAQAKLDALKNGSRSQTVAEAKAALDTAEAKLAVVKQGPRSEAVAEAKSNLETAQSKLRQLLDGPTPDQIAASKLSVQQAQDSLFSAQTSRDLVCGPSPHGASCKASNATVDASQTGLDLANQNLKTLVDPPTQEAINQAQEAVDTAQQAYDLAQKPYTDQDLAQANAAVASAQAAYDLTLSPYTNQDLAQAQAAVDAAAAQAKLAAQPYTDLDLKAAQDAVNQAQAALDIAKANLAQANVVAPFDGVVTTKLLSLGALATPSTPIVTLNSPHLQVQFSVDEAKIGNIKAGDAVVLTSSAFPGQNFPATVSSVYPTADPKTHTFSVVVEPKDTTGSLRAGMFVTLNVTVASFAQAVLVPNAAVVQQGSQPVVYTVGNNQAHLVPITVGIVDDNNSQILSGVKAGDTVVTSNQSNLTDGAAVRVVGAGGAGNQAAPGAGSATPASRGRSPAGTPSPASQG
jgi:HlyD family secretion protein